MLINTRQQFRWLVGGTGIAAVVAVALTIFLLSNGDTHAPPPQDTSADSVVQGQTDSGSISAISDGQSDPAKAAPVSANSLTTAQPSNGAAGGDSGTKELINLKDSVVVSVSKLEPRLDGDSPPIASEIEAAINRQEAAQSQSSGTAFIAPPNPRRQGKPGEGIRVGVKGFIEVREPDGTLVSRNDFK